MAGSMRTFVAKDREDEGKFKGPKSWSKTYPCRDEM